MKAAERIEIPLDGTQALPGLWQAPPDAVACLVLAHGAGAGMDHRAMAATADGLASRRIATLRYDFPYMARGSRRPDPPAIAHAAVRAAVNEAARRASALPLFAGGRSYGGRMTSQAHAIEPLPGVRGLVFFAFPLHPAGKPSDDRAAHLAGIREPMLFLQGTRDTLAEMHLLEPVIERVGASSLLVREADHAFRMPARSGRSDRNVVSEILDVAGSWMRDRIEDTLMPERAVTAAR